MILFDYIVNLSIFSLMVSTPLVMHSFISRKPLGKIRIFGGVYAGIVSIILVLLAIHHEGYSYDIRYAPVILVYAYLGPVAGFLTGSFAIVLRLVTGDNWLPAIVGWGIIVIAFTVICILTKRLTPVKRSVTLFCSYILIYIITVPIIFKVIRDNPVFHFQYLLFVMLGVILGVLLIESYMKLHRLNSKYSSMFMMVAATQEELKHTLATLEESENKYRLIAENTSDLIMVMDKNLSTSYYSPSHQLVLGYTGAELQSTKLSKFIPSEDVILFKETLKKLFEQNEPQSVEFLFKHKNGHWVNLESRCMPVMGEKQSIEHIVIISRDISERKKAEEFLLQSEKLSIVGELAAGVAHEIRNPLTTIKGFVQLYKNEERSVEFTDLLLSELERIETITSELLSLGKPQAVQMNRTNLRGLIENTLELLAPQAHMNDIQFKASFEDCPFFVIAEKNQLKQVFLNILKNAMEAMQDGGVININLQKGTEGDCILSFKDQGCGIPEELIPRLGEPFYSLKEKGTGLGLMICHKIIKQHHGTITYHSKVKEGTLIEITLPLAE
ncbi:MAG TPA: ATP-binding protein [Pseudoneobacillus sp.]|nr:ATP-binding protein [Pseudoneobacillus sp.]